MYMPSLIEINDSGDDQVMLCCLILNLQERRYVLIVWSIMLL